MTCAICVSIAAADLASMHAALVGAERADLVELRLDALVDPETIDSSVLRALVEASPTEVLFTCRCVAQGGAFTGSEQERRGVLKVAADVGPAFIDVELDAPWADELLLASRVPVVLSHHWAVPRPSDLAERVAAMQARRPAIAKLVAPAERTEDILPLVEAGRNLVTSGQPAACFCTGEAGRTSRLLVATYDGALTYAASSLGETAAGQWDASELLDELRLSRWSSTSILCGLIGDPIEGSLSPRIFNEAFAVGRLPFAYVPIPGSCFKSSVALAEAMGFHGLSVTMPFKEDAAAFCVKLSSAAERCGAVNTMVAIEGGWVGHNTDAQAVIEAILTEVRTRDRLAGARVALLGAGGASRAAAVALSTVGAQITVLNRTPDHAQEVAELIGGVAGPLDRLCDESYDILVNATPVGMGDEMATPVPIDWLSGKELVMDMVYRPEETALLRAARARGCRTVPGLRMFLAQAAAQYRLWTGVEPAIEALRAAAAEGLAG